MAHVYRLTMDPSLTEEKAREILVRLPGFKPEGDGFSPPGLYVWVFPPDTDEPDYFEAKWGFEPGPTIVFRWDKQTDPVMVESEIVDAVMKLIQPDTKFALLTYEDVILMLFREGVYVLEEETDYWRDFLLKKLPGPVVREPLKKQLNARRAALDKEWL